MVYSNVATDERTDRLRIVSLRLDARRRIPMIRTRNDRSIVAGYLWSIVRRLERFRVDVIIVSSTRTLTFVRFRRASVRRTFDVRETTSLAVCLRDPHIWLVPEEFVSLLRNATREEARGRMK